MLAKQERGSLPRILCNLGVQRPDRLHTPEQTSVFSMRIRYQQIATMLYSPIAFNQRRRGTCKVASAVLQSKP